MKIAPFPWIFLLLALALCLDRIEKLTAVQELQRQGYERIMLVNRIRFAAGIRTNCSFFQHSRLTFYATYGHLNKGQMISVCIGTLGSPTFHPGE